ncbi:MAG: hypothetical protein V7K25_12120 [Nostoc sp.]|uniref:hypothetical protein n=1 Tax=Nostoc sp. TaxID=1180 RepID=UPI002FF6E133
MMNDAEKQKYALQIMSEAFKRFLKENIGNVEDKPIIEILAWSRAMLELEQEFRAALLTKDENLEL